jgi:hypothetical protein
VSFSIPIPVFLDLPNGIFLFQINVNTKCMRQMFTYTDLSVGSYNHILINLTGYMSIQNSIRMLYNILFQLNDMLS